MAGAFFCPYQRRFRETSHFIAPSINMSLSTLHRRWMTTCRLAEQLRKSGWLKCYRGENGWANACDERTLWDDLGIRYEVLDARQLSEKSSALRPVFCPRRLSAGRAVGAQSPNYDPRLRRLVYRRGRAIYSSDITALQADKQGGKCLCKITRRLAPQMRSWPWGRGQRIS